jgi:hypothetical protein
MFSECFALRLPFRITLIEVGNRFLDLCVTIRLCPNRELRDNIALLVRYDSQEREIIVRDDPYGGVVVFDGDDRASVNRHDNSCDALR